MSDDIGYQGLAIELGVSVRFLERRINDMPHLQLGRKVSFTPAHVAEIKAMFEYRPAGEVKPIGLRPVPARQRRRAS